MAPRNTALTIKEKLLVISLLKDKEKTKNQLAMEFKCDISTINRILRNEAKIRALADANKNVQLKRYRKSNHADVEKALTIWFHQMRIQNDLVSTQIVKNKAKEIAMKMNSNFEPSNGWLWRWQKRENIKFSKRHGERNDDDNKDESKRLSTSVLQNYSPQDIFNTDGSGLIYKGHPNETISPSSDQLKGGNHLDGEQLKGKMLCCVCLLENPSNMGIFDDIGQQLQIAEVIQKYLWFKPQPDNNMTNQICTICWHKIDDFHIFYQTVEKAHKEFEQNATTNIKIEIPCSSPIKLEEDYDEKEIIGNNDDGTSQPINEIQIKNPLEESYNIEIFNEESDYEDCKSSDDYEPSPSSHAESSNDDEAVCDDETFGVKKKNKKEKRKLDFNKVKDITKKRRIVHRLDPIHTEEMIKKHIPMGCNLCVFVGTTFSDIVTHFRSAHPKVRPYIMCCDKKLSKRFFVAQHAMKHEDPNCFRCEECNKSFTAINGLRAHNLNYHARNEDLIFACENCPKKFARRNLLELHKPSHLPREQWQHFCNICPDKRKFASNYLLNVHISMRHKREINICPVCAKKIKDKKSYEKHVRLHYEDSGPRIKCPYPDCDSWLKDEDNLRQHMSRHNPEGVVYKCDECDKECKNRRALTNHKRYAHTNQIFQCDQCDKTFKKAISLREHLTQHTGETLYKCPFCTRTFNSNANMHAHKKKQHPIEWEDWRKTKRGSAQKLINSKNPLGQIDDFPADLNDTLSIFK